MPKMMLYRIVLVLFMLTNVKPTISEWQQGSMPKVVIDHNATLNSATRFLGDQTKDENETTAINNYFRILGRDHDSLLVSGRNILYNISVDRFQKKHRLEWKPDNETRENCRRKGQQSAECNNFMRVVIKLDDKVRNGNESRADKYTICGTNAFEPKCRNFSIDEPANDILSPNVTEEWPGKLRLGYDPRQNSSYVVADGKLFSATASDFAGVRPILARDGFLRTHPQDVPFNEPHFVGGFADNQFVYFGIRETATEYINCGKRVFPRIARVCRDDPGYKAPSRKVPFWTSFSKARLNCSVPGDYPFYFDELHGLAASGIVIGRNRQRVLYAVFTTPENSLSATAVCAYDMTEIERVFANSRFKSPKNDKSDMNWLPVDDADVPAGAREALQCSYNSTSSIADKAARFIETHPLMDRAVPAMYGRPVLISTVTNSRLSPLRFRSIDVLPQVEAVDGNRYDVLFIGTNDGRLLKVINTLGPDGIESSQSPVIVEEQHVLSAPITSVQIADKNRVVVVSDNELVSLPIHHCGDSKTCGTCVARQDPHCAWHTQRNECLRFDFKDVEWLLQNMQTGKHSNCTEADATPEPPNIINRHHKSITFVDSNQVDADNMVPDIKASQVLPVSGAVYREETLALAVVITLILSLIVGFVAGYQLNRWRMTKSDTKDSNLSVGSNLSDYAQFPSHLDSTTISSDHNNSHNVPFGTAGGVGAFVPPPPNLLLNNGSGANGANFPHLSAETFFRHQNEELARQQYLQQKKLRYNAYALEPSSTLTTKQQMMLNVNPTATIIRHTSSVGGFGANKMLYNDIGQSAVQSGISATATLPRLNTLRRDLAALSTSKAYL